MQALVKSKSPCNCENSVYSLMPRHLGVGSVRWVCSSMSASAMQENQHLQQKVALMFAQTNQTHNDVMATSITHLFWCCGWPRLFRNHIQLRIN